ncbi:penicillin acylase family protein [Marinicauda algicola]|uniref:Penicillin acylase family protein n=1 Tax=Marinicauda algicola TaxID=2029849 RepID=A0A4S2H4M2_9PROT|nr:penicillin acylase family protein [Marinicauda algicola]TGY90576.1 penicillin acylase family protein [Marinicauda algicola]
MVKWIVRGVIALVVVALLTGLGAAGWLGWRFQSSRPQTEGRVGIEGYDGRATIVRDENGTAHIFGERDADVYFALGYTHADERFFQMDLARRFVHGRLAELFGERAIRSDAQSRIKGFPQAAEAVLANLSPQARAATEAYVAGVNARLARGRPAPEYAILRTEPEPWRMVDSAGLTLYLADSLAAGAGDDVERASLADLLTPQQFEQFRAQYPDWGPTTLKDEDLAPRFSEITEEVLPPPGDESEALSQPDNLPGSNAWVVDGSRTASGAPLLANDPHLALAAPSIWYMVRLELEATPVVGASTPGTPFIILGRNAHGAWGFTNTGFDVIDWVERDPAGLNITERTETIRVKGGEDVELTVWETAEGPILDPAWFSLEAFDTENKAVVLRWTVTDPGNDVADATYRIMHSTGWDSFVEATRGWTAPMQNMHYAGVDGTIGYSTAGLLPIRDRDGNWTGFIPFEDLPRVRNPQGGAIASGNNLVAGEAYPYPLPGSYGIYRAPRIEELLDANPAHDAASFNAMQMDVTSAFARRIHTALIGADPETQLGLEALARIERWDGTLSGDGPEGLIFSAWIKALTAAVYSDELGPEFERFFYPRRLFIERVLTGDASAWCDDIRTGEVESCAVIAGLALDSAMAELELTHGDDIDAWRWADSHRALFDHPFTGVPVIGDWFTVETPVGGDGSTLNVGHFSYRSGDYTVYHGPSLRAVYDLSDLDASRFMHAPGQSGHPWSKRYRDLAPRWAQGDSYEIRTDWTPDAAPENSRVLVLEGG